MSLVLLAKSFLESRRRLERHLPARLCASPALMVLLDLFISDAIHREMTVGSCCTATGAPHATALRWLKMLEAERLIERKPHPSDARSSVVCLSPLGRDALAAWLGEYDVVSMPAASPSTSPMVLQ